MLSPESSLMLKQSLLFFIYVVNASIVSAQPWLKVDSLFNPSGVSVQNFSSPFFGDLDADGEWDLLLGNGSSTRVDYFRNLGVGVPPHFQRDTSILASIYAGGTAGTNSDYPVMVDMDGDGDLDLVIGGFNGLLYYNNVGDTLAPQWQRIDSLFAAINVEIGTDAKPALADLDGDGDPDLLVGIGESLFGGPPAGVTFGYRNVGSPSAPSFIRDSTLVLGIPDIGLNSYPTLADIDGDGDFNLLLGRDLQTLVYFRNTGSTAAPIWTSNATTFNVVEATTYWKQPTLCDLDHDGDLDLTYGTSDGTLFHYENLGSSTTPSFQFQSSYFEILRISGNGARASLADFDNDGDFDMMSGDWLGRIQYFRNDGTQFSPRFTKATSTFTSIDVGSYSTPVFVDIDGDNDQDIVSGALDGMVYCFINNGSGFTQNTIIFAGIDVGFLSAPGLADLDGDGDLDLLVGTEEAPAMVAYKNQGANVFALDPSLMTGISSVRNASPAFFDLEQDGDNDLVLGGSFGQMLFYENTGTTSSPVWTRNDPMLAGVGARQNAGPAFADMDGDGLSDVIVGEYNGNFSYYVNQRPTSVHERDQLPLTFELMQNYPNPFNPSTKIKLQIPGSNTVTLKVYDMLGREVRTLVDGNLQAGSFEVTFDASGLVSGVYLYRLQAGERTQTRRLLLLR